MVDRSSVPVSRFWIVSDRFACIEGVIVSGWTPTLTTTSLSFRPLSKKGGGSLPRLAINPGTRKKKLTRTITIPAIVWWSVNIPSPIHINPTPAKTNGNATSQKGIRVTKSDRIIAITMPMKPIKKQTRPIPSNWRVIRSRDVEPLFGGGGVVLAISCLHPGVHPFSLAVPNLSAEVAKSGVRAVRGLRASRFRATSRVRGPALRVAVWVLGPGVAALFKRPAVVPTTLRMPCGQVSLTWQAWSKSARATRR